LSSSAVKESQSLGCLYQKLTKSLPKTILKRLLKWKCENYRGTWH